MLRKLCINNGRLVETSEDKADVFVYIGPDEAERRHLVDDLKIDEHTLSSSFDPDELSRLEFEPEHIAMIFKRPKHYHAEDEFLFTVVSTGVFIFKDKLIVVIAEEALLF